MISIRQATPTDVPAIAQVHVDSWRTSYAGLISDTFLQNLSVESRRRAWADILSTPEHPVFLFVAVNEAGQIVGFASGCPERENDPEYTGEVGAIYLLKEAQGQGIGRKLMHATASELIQRGHQSMLLWVLRDNNQARKFYEALGGHYLREKPLEIGGQMLIEVAYGWKNLRLLAER